MNDLLISRELLDFQLFDWLNAEDAVDRETVRSILDVAYRLAEDAFLPTFREGDTKEPYLENGEAKILPSFHEALRRYRELGMQGVSFPEEYGGSGLGSAINFALFAIYSSANIAILAYASLSASNARVILAFGTPAQIDAFARPQVEGRYFGTMCLSEPQAGSSLGDIRTRAVRDGEDELGHRYRLIGNKMWISAGDQDFSENLVHLVLAKVAREDGTLPEGTKGISLFIVPKYLANGSRNDLAVAGLNHKMGYRGTTNCLLNFGEAEGAQGWLVGAEGQGLAQMFMMMNEARIGVGTGAAAVGYRGYRHAARYAHERLQGRPHGVRDGDPVPIVNHPDVRRMLLQAKAYAEGALALCLYSANLADRHDDESAKLLALLTPITKSWPSEFGLIANDLAIQVHGGYGYTRDFDVEQLWRDNRLNAIHEGTTGIQAIDLLGRKLLFSDGEPLTILRRRIAATVERARAIDPWAVQSDDLDRYWDEIAGVLDQLKPRTASDAFDNATYFMRAFGHGVVAWLWLDQAIVAAKSTNPVLGEAMGHAARYFFDTELPQARAWLAIGSRTGMTRSTPDSVFA